ncbi:MAG: MinD/ParA family protein [Actinomycetota bacterium]|nr:MinD/ParA family protein [Actinomycetota bacterium]
MARRTEPDPSTWWETYGHRLEGPPVAPPPPEPEEPDDPSTDGPVERQQGRQMATARSFDPDLPDLSEDAVLKPRAARPRAGWRRVLYELTGGRVNPGPGTAEEARQELLARIRSPLAGAHRVAVTSIKGGVGKTTVATCLGLTLAENRGDRAVVLDANPDAGTLADRLTGDSRVTVRELLDDLDQVQTWTDVSRYTSLAGRLQVLASEQDPAAGEAFRRDEYERVCALLGRFFNIIITDSGTGLVHSAMEGTLSAADSLVVVGAPTVDGASRASKTLDWLVAHGHDTLARDAIVVLSCDRSSAEVDGTRIREHFAGRVRAVVEIPHDAHLATGGRVDLTRLRPSTVDAFLELGALIGDAFDVRAGARRR